jgi:photosystem II stability/assembly factor-like uncharacterized protein
MKIKGKFAASAWTPLGGPLAGTISALAVAVDHGRVVFIGSKVGLYRSAKLAGHVLNGWGRLPAAPIGIMSLAVSPDYAADHFIIAGTDKGIFLSRDSGETWLAAQLPMERTMVLSIGFSPDYAADHTLIAGTLEDGILYSDTNGKTWHLKSFGLLDGTVFSLAISPDFTHDEILYAGTDTAIYYSYNKARAWKQLEFPEDAPPVLSLLISPDFSTDQTLYAGTETQGLYCSRDQGAAWAKLNTPFFSVNALAFWGQTLLAASEAGIYQSTDQGLTWRCLAGIPNAISLVTSDKLALAGLVEQGICLSLETAEWKPVNIPAIRSMVGFVLSPEFTLDQIAFMYGPQEGIWRTTDGGATWVDSAATLPSLDIQDLVVSPGFSQNRTVLAAFAEGLFISCDGGSSWQLQAAQPVNRMSFSPNGKRLIASLPDVGLCLSGDFGKTWQVVPGPWEKGGRTVGLAISDLFDFHAALIDGSDESLSIWQGKPGKIEKVLDLPAAGSPVVSFWLPTEAAANRPWFASAGNKVWRFSSRQGNPFTESIVFTDPALQEVIFSLVGVQGEDGLVLFACTGQHIYRSVEGGVWATVHESTAEPILQLSLDPEYAANSTAYIMLLGGKFYRGLLK